MKLILYVRKFFCDTADSARKVFSEAVQRLFSCVLSEMKAAIQQAEGETASQKEAPVSVEEWRPDPGAQVTRITAIRRPERCGKSASSVLHPEVYRVIKRFRWENITTAPTEKDGAHDPFSWQNIEEFIPKAVYEP